MKCKLKLASVAVAALLAGAGVASAEEVFVKQTSIVIRAGKGAAYDEVGKAVKGDKLQIIAREGKWLKVKTNSGEGYVFETAVAETKPGDDMSGIGKMLGGASGSSTASDAAAGKGFGESLDWAKSKRMSPAGLNRMIALRKSVTGKDWEQFTDEGKVGPAK